MKLIKSLAAAAALAIGAPMSANATATIEVLYDGVFFASCVDGDACDQTGNGVGAVAFAVNVGGFSLNISSTGTTKPQLQVPDLMDLSVTGSINNTSGLTHTLQVLFTDTAFIDAGVVTGFYGNTNGLGLKAATASAWYGNTPFDMTNLIDSVNVASHNNGEFTGLVAQSPYSLTAGLSFTADNGDHGSLSSDFHLSVPEPTSIALVGVSLLGLGVASRRRKV